MHVESKRKKQIVEIAEYGKKLSLLEGILLLRSSRNCGAQRFYLKRSDTFALPSWFDYAVNGTTFSRRVVQDLRRSGRAGEEREFLGNGILPGNARRYSRAREPNVAAESPKLRSVQANVCARTLKCMLIMTIAELKRSRSRGQCFAPCTIPRIWMYVPPFWISWDTIVLCWTSTWMTFKFYLNLQIWRISFLIRTLVVEMTRTKKTSVVMSRNIDYCEDYRTKATTANSRNYGIRDNSHTNSGIPDSVLNIWGTEGKREWNFPRFELMVTLPIC